MTDEEKCPCGYGPGPTCHPSCPSYEPPPPTEVTGKVAITGHVQTRAPDNASYRQYQYYNGSEPFQMLGKDDGRCRALLWADATGVIIGRRDAVMNGIGVALPANVTVELKNGDEVWGAVVDEIASEPLTVNVVNERYT